MDFQFNFKPLLFWYYDSRSDVLRAYSDEDRVSEYFRSDLSSNLEDILAYFQEWENTPVIGDRPTHFGIDLDLDRFAEKVPVQRDTTLILRLKFQSCSKPIVLNSRELEYSLISEISSYISQEFSRMIEPEEIIQ
jgi:hypothetical protein